MQRVLIRLVALLTLVAGLLATAMVVLPSRVGPLVEKEARARGIDVRLGGVSVDLFRGRIELADLQLANEEGYDDDSLTAAQRVTLEASVGPLVRGELRVDGVHAHAPFLSVERLADGHINLLDFLARVIGDQEAIEALLDSAPPFNIARFEVSDGRLHLTDRDVPADPVELEVTDLEVLAENVTRPMPEGVLGTPFSVSGSFAPPQGGTFTAEGTGDFLSGALDFTMDLRFSRVGVEALAGYFMGYPIVPEEGTASGTLTMTCSDNYVRGVAYITFYDLAVTANRHDPLVKRLPSLAAARLVELQPIADFEVPFQGDLTDPDYHLFRSILFSSMAYASDLSHELIDRAGATGGVIAENVKGRVSDVASGAADTTRKVVGSAADTTRNVVGEVRERSENVVDEVRREDDDEGRRLRGRRDKRSEP